MSWIEDVSNVLKKVITSPLNNFPRFVPKNG
jgi:hypothetical protein